jgi:hypothetical protein
LGDRATRESLKIFGILWLHSTGFSFKALMFYLTGARVTLSPRRFSPHVSASLDAHSQCMSTTSATVGESSMSEQASSSLGVHTALVWRDPDLRTVQWNPRAFIPAALIFNCEYISVMDADGDEHEVLSASPKDLSVRWLGKYRCDLTAGAEIRRLYFEPPNSLTRRHSKAALDRIGSAVGTAGYAGKFGHFVTGAAAVGDYAVLLGFVGKAFALHRSISEHKAAKLNVAKLKEVLPC